MHEDTIERNTLHVSSWASRRGLGFAALALAAVLVGGAGTAGAAATPLDLNSASMAELEALPGIGAAKAAAIIEERQVRPFADVDDLERVRGIGPALLAELRTQVTVSAPAQKKAQ